VKFLDSLAENNYYFTKILNVEKVEKTTKIVFDKGKNFNEAKVKFSSETALFLKSKPNFYQKFRFSQTSYQSKIYRRRFCF
jgi:hypothetical protein